MSFNDILYRWIMRYMTFMGMIMWKRGGNNDYQIQQQQAEEARKSQARAELAAMFDSDEAKAKAKADETELANAIRDYYQAQFADVSKSAERNLRFGAATQGQIGGSIFADETGEFDRDKKIGATRIEDAVTRAINEFRAGREASRTQANALINSGSGSEGVAAARAGLDSSLSAAKSKERVALFDDLFTTLALGKMYNDTNSKNAAIAAMARKPATYTPGYTQGTVYGA